jgi:hypothetical protein
MIAIMARRYSRFFPVLLLFFLVPLRAQEEFLKIETQILPRIIMQGEEGTLKIKITPKSGIRISSNPEFLIKFEENDNFSFPKIFFSGSELNFPTTQEKEGVILDLQKEIEIPFKVMEMALIGKQTISGEITFTALFQDNWCIKTTQKFASGFTSRRNYKLKKK